VTNPIADKSPKVVNNDFRYVEAFMAEESLPADDPKLPSSRQFRFSLRHVFYLLTIACVLLGIPMLGAAFSSLFTACIIAAIILGPLIVAQALVVLLVPGLRRRLFAKSPPGDSHAKAQSR
jgi:hypothetical protein